MASPYERRAKPIPVTVVTAGLSPLGPETALVRLSPQPGHSHDPGEQCVACAARSDVRTLLFNLLEEVRRGSRSEFSSVLVDATALSDPQTIIDALTPGRLPSRGLADHAVAHNFRLVASSAN
jgi:hypothetical protein